MYLEQYNHWMKQENLESYLKEQLEKMTEIEKEDAFQCHLVKCHLDFQRHGEINFNFTMPFFLSVKH